MGFLSEISNQNFGAQSRLHSPLFCYGGKGLMARKLLPMIQYPHGTYVEPFAGGASIFFGKQPMGVEVLNDLEEGVVGFYKLVQNPELFPEFYRRVYLTPYSREEYYYCRDTWKQESGMLRYYKWFIAKKQSFSGEGRDYSSWSYGRSISSNGMGSKPSAFLYMIDALPAVHRRLLKTVIEYMDFRDVIKKYDAYNTFFYIDPPYMLETRNFKWGYTHELGTIDHKELIEMLLGIKGKALVSCYDHEIYQRLLKYNWNRKSWKTSAHSAGRTRGSGLLGKGAASKMQPRVETVYFNYKYLS